MNESRQKSLTELWFSAALDCTGLAVEIRKSPRTAEQKKINCEIYAAHLLAFKALEAIAKKQNIITHLGSDFDENIVRNSLTGHPYADHLLNAYLKVRKNFAFDNLGICVPANSFDESITIER
jgi:hypothetical protein